MPLVFHVEQSVATDAGVGAGQTAPVLMETVGCQFYSPLVQENNTRDVTPCHKQSELTRVNSSISL